MLRWQTAGESHGEALVAMIEGLPAGVHITTEDIVGALARRRLGYGRGARMKFEQDKVRMLTGVRFGETIGSPVAIEIANTEWPKWTEVMSADPLDHELAREGRNAPLSRPRPGHADLTGMRKYGFDDARPVLERSSARETASRVALGEVAKQFLEQAFGIRAVSRYRRKNRRDYQSQASLLWSLSSVDGRLQYHHCRLLVDHRTVLSSTDLRIE